jgi:hypothetical protein
MLNNKPRWALVLVLVLATALISSALTYSYTRSLYNPRNEYVLYFNKDELTKSDVAKFSEVWNLLKENFYYDIDEREMFEGAIAGLAAGLKDPYTIYYTKEQIIRLPKILALKPLRLRIGSANGIWLYTPPPCRRLQLFQ